MQSKINSSELHEHVKKHPENCLSISCVPFLKKHCSSNSFSNVHIRCIEIYLKFSVLS